MKQLRLMAAAFAAVLWAAPLHAQNTGSVSGRVIDAATQEALAGVSVSIGARSAVSQADGRFFIAAVPAGRDSVRTRLLGYAPSAQLVTVTAGQTIAVNFALNAVNIQLSELVSIGYGQQTAGNVTGAVDQVNREQMNPGAVIAPAGLIQGKVSGVQVVDNNEPGGGLSVRVRGQTSINASSEPLYVIDGVPVGPGGGISAGRDPLNFLNPDDIETITVLKDGSAAAIYGANGASGVVIITTRAGRRGGPSFEYSSSVSASQVTRTPDMLNAAEFRAAVMQYADTAHQNQLGSANTNWFDLITRTAVGQQHNLSVAGAGDANNWRLSLGYMNQDGVVRGTTAQRLSLGVNYGQNLFHERVNVRANLRGSRTKDEFTPGGVLGNAASYGPTQPVVDASSPTGFYEWPGNSLTSGDNPMAILALAQSHGTTYRSLGNLQTDWHMPWLNNNLSAHANLGFDVTQVSSVAFNPSVMHQEQKNQYLGELWHNDNNMANTVLETYLTYARPLSFSRMNANLDLTAGYSYSQSHAEYTSLYERGLKSDLLGTNGIPLANTVSNSSPIDESKLISFFGRANYNIGDRYIFAASVRRDGSSRFGPNNAWGVFPSAAFAWRISQEGFMSSFRSLSDLKLRVSWAKTGNQAFGNYLQYSAYLYGNPQAQVQFGNQFITTIRPGAVDPNIKWEATTSTDVGLDFGFNNQRLSGTIDYYNKKTSDMIFNVPVAAGTNLSNFVTTNIGSMRNKGIELALHYRLLDGGRRGFTWNTDFTASHNTNEVLSINPNQGTTQVLVGGISGGVGNTVQVLTPGSPAYAFFLCRQAYDNAGKPIQGSYYNTAGDSVVTRCSDNRQAMHSPAPTWILGHSSYITRGNWDFSFTLRAYLGNYVYNNVASASGDYRELFAGTSSYNLHRSVLETGFTQAQYLSDYYLEKASFLRMDNLSLGYTFNYRGQPVRLYGTVQNVLTLTGYSGVDPTAGFNGIDNNIYPRARTFTGGLSLRF